MIDGVHHHSAHVRTTPLPPRASRFAARYIHVIDVSHLANRGEAVFMNPSNFTGRHFHQRVTALDVGQRRLLPSTACNLSAAAWSQFNIVNVSAKGNGTKRQRISQIRRSVISGDDSRTDSKSVRRENVTQFAIRIFDESNAGGAVRVVLDPDYFSWDIALASFKIDLAIFLLMAAADVP